MHIALIAHHTHARQLSFQPNRARGCIASSDNEAVAGCTLVIDSMIYSTNFKSLIHAQNGLQQKKTLSINSSLLLFSLPCHRRRMKWNIKTSSREDIWRFHVHDLFTFCARFLWYAKLTKRRTKERTRRVSFLMNFFFGVLFNVFTTPVRIATGH